MPAADNSWSRGVALLKVVLPLIALALLSSIFLLSRPIDPTAAIPKSGIDLQDRAREPRLTAPTFSGMTSDGAAISITASDMRPDIANPQSGSAIDLKARMETPDGAQTDLAAATGRVDTAAGTFAMSGGVTITNSAGYTITAPDMQGRLDATAVDATGGVVAEAPMGRITAETLQIRPDPRLKGQYDLVFKDEVRLIYEP